MYFNDIAGFLSAGRAPLLGNYGIQDQIHVLKWVRDNIHSFKGDSSQVTLFGHSAGGSCVGMLLVIPAAQGIPIVEHDYYSAV